MKKYHRFHHDAPEWPLLFFVAAFVLGTIALGGTFLFFARERSREDAPAAPAVSAPGSPALESADEVLPAIDAAAYQRAIRAAFDTFHGAFVNTTGGWVDASGWDIMIQDASVAQAIDRAADTLRTTLINTRVPGPARTQHLLMVVTVENLLEALRSDRVEAMEGLLLRLEELIKNNGS